MEHCADGCLPEWIGDGECDEACNVRACLFDRNDCSHGRAESRGEDYRGSVSTTEKGYTCQSWAQQFPHQHARTHKQFPGAGLGGHNHCRNPDGEARPYCFTTDVSMRWDYCDVGSPSSHGCSDAAPGVAAASGAAGDGQMAPRPREMAFIPGAGALPTGEAAADAVQEILAKGSSIAGPVALGAFVLSTMCWQGVARPPVRELIMPAPVLPPACAVGGILVGLLLLQRPVKERGYVVTAVEDHGDAYDDDGDEEGGVERSLIAGRAWPHTP